MKTIEEYAIHLVANGAESVAEDDLNEDGEIEPDEHEDATDLALKIIHAIRENPQILLGLADGREYVTSTEHAVTRKQSDVWQAVMTDRYGVVVGFTDLEVGEAPVIYVLRGTSTPIDGKLPERYDEADVAHQWEQDDYVDGEVARRYANAEAMAAGLNAAAVHR